MMYNGSGRVGRSNRTREERMDEILAYLVNISRTDYPWATATAVARQLGLAPSQYVRDMCNQLVDEGHLRCVTCPHGGAVQLKMFYRWLEPKFPF